MRKEAFGGGSGGIAPCRARGRQLRRWGRRHPRNFRSLGIAFAVSSGFSSPLGVRLVGIGTGGRTGGSGRRDGMPMMNTLTMNSSPHPRPDHHEDKVDFTLEIGDFD